MEKTDVLATAPEPGPTAAHSNTAVLPNLDGIRAMACLLVVISHMPLPGKSPTMGALGVAVFFVLSGFLMSYLYGRAKWDFEAVSLYIIARFSRIAPIYWLVVTVCIFISYYEPDSDFPMKVHGAQQIFRHYFFGGSGYVFWSIPPEIQYYIFFLLVWWAIAQRRKLIYALPLVALLCSALLLSHSSWPGLTLPNKIHLFLAGTIAGLIPRDSWQKSLDQSTLMALQLGALAVLVSPLWLYDSQPALYAATELGVALAVAVYLLSLPSAWTTLIFASSFMRKIGQASFSIYLMHVLVFYFGQRVWGLKQTKYDPIWLALGIAAVLLPMLASKYVEMPLQRKTRRSLENLYRRVYGRATPQPQPQQSPSAQAVLK